MVTKYTPPRLSRGHPGTWSCGSEVSWDAQADLEQASLKRTRLVMLTVDYYKFFDSFDHSWVRHFLHLIELPHAIVEMIL